MSDLLHDKNIKTILTFATKQKMMPHVLHVLKHGACIVQHEGKSPLLNVQ